MGLIPSMQAYVYSTYMYIIVSLAHSTIACCLLAGLRFFLLLWGSETTVFLLHRPEGRERETFLASLSSFFRSVSLAKIAKGRKKEKRKRKESFSFFLAGLAKLYESTEKGEKCVCEVVATFTFKCTDILYISVLWIFQFFFQWFHVSRFVCWTYRRSWGRSTARTSTVTTTSKDRGFTWYIRKKQLFFERDVISSYSQVKWYKGTHEFYRYTPGDRDAKKFFVVQNMHVDVRLLKKDIKTKQNFF